jgi:hypothetical protein
MQKADVDPMISLITTNLPTMSHECNSDIVDVNATWVRIRGGPDGLMQSNRVVLYEAGGARRPLLMATCRLHTRDEYLPRMMLLHGGVLLRSELPVRADEVLWHACVRVAGVSLPMFELFAAVVLRCLGERVDCFQTALALMAALLVVPERFVLQDNATGAPGGVLGTSFATRHISLPKALDPRQLFASRVVRIVRPHYALLIGQFFDAERRHTLVVYLKVVGQVVTNAMLTDSLDSFLPWFALCERAAPLPAPVSLYDFVMEYFREHGWVQLHAASEAADVFRTPKL